MLARDAACRVSSVCVSCVCSCVGVNAVTDIEDGAVAGRRTTLPAAARVMMRPDGDMAASSCVSASTCSSVRVGMDDDVGMAMRVLLLMVERAVDGCDGGCDDVSCMLCMS